MRQSYYNQLAKRDGHIVLYNTLSQNIVSLSEDEAVWLGDLDNCPDADFVKQLAELQFVHDDPEVECEWLKYQHLRYAQGNDIFDLTVSPSQECNYACPYCYVLKRDGFMSESVQDKLFEFVRDQYAQEPFKTLRVNWYGGEPLLGIEVMERLSAMLIAFCRENGIEYLGHVLTNCSLADEDMVRRLVDNCGITSVMPTISGKGDMQDWQRPAKDGTHYFDTIMHNIDLLTQAGVIVLINFVTNCNNCEGCLELAGERYGAHNTEIRLTETFPFSNGTVHLAGGKHDELAYFTPEQYADYRVRFYRGMNLGAEGYRKVLEPLRLNCAGWLRRGFFVDDRGDVSGCMVDMDYPGERTFFNVLDWGSDDLHLEWDRYVAMKNLNPMDYDDCRHCVIFPICRGGCCDHWLDPAADKCKNQINWKLALPDIVLDYYDALVAEQGESHV